MQAPILVNVNHFIEHAPDARTPEPRGATPRVVVCVLTWNGYEISRACIQSLTGLAGWPVPVVVVDNASGTREGERLANEFGPPVTAMRLPVNQFVAGGYNAAIRWAAAQDATHVLLLNNDTLISAPDMLERMAAAVSADVAVVGPLVLDRDGTLYSAGGSISWGTGLARHMRTPVDRERPYPVPWLDGSCLLVSLEAVRRVGGLDPVFGLYWEETDWCIRAGRAGYRCLVEPRTTIVHLRGGSIATSGSEAHDLRNGILFMRRHGSAVQNVTALGFFLFVRLPAFLARRASSRARLVGALRAAGKAIAWNAQDARRRGTWRVPPGGPQIEDMPTPSD
jgi:GT2 family glycosyltransferase